MSFQHYQIKSGEPHTHHFPGLDFLVNLEFSGNSLYYAHYSTSDPTPINRPLPKISILINRQDLHHQEKARQLITTYLLAWPLTDVHRREIVEIALRRTWESLAPMPSCHNFIGLGFRANLLTHFVLWSDDDADDGETEEPMDVGGGVVGMVPATELSIENLESKKAQLVGSGCPVCMEEFPLDCEVIRMPCSHDFHGDCIKEWLRASHYCPVCRFEMPTS